MLNADGTLNWKAGYHFQVPGTFKSVSSPIQTPDGGYVITGSTYDASVKKSYGLIAKIDSLGEVAFQNTFDDHVSGSVFATADGGSFLLGSSAGSTSLDLLVSKVNSERNVPGCDYFQSFGTTKRTSFGRLRIKDVNITEPADVLLKPIDFGLTSVVTNSPVSTLCH